MTQATRLLSTLRAFHLDQPDATWAELRERLKEIAEDILNTRSVWSQIDMGQGQIYSDLREDLSLIAATEPLSYAGARAVTVGARIMQAGEERLQGNLKPIMGIIDELNGGVEVDSVGQSLPVPICKTAPQDILQPAQVKAMTFSALYDAFIVERGREHAPKTKMGYKSSKENIVAVLGDLDFLNHTRANMLALQTALLETRKISTVNKIMTHLSTIVGWGVATGLLKHDYTTKLSISKGAESGREPFSNDQIASLKGWAMNLATGNPNRAGMLLGIALGLRIGEIGQLKGEDFYKVEGQWVVSINTEGDKTLKNPQSRRVVPLIGVPLDIPESFSTITGKVFKQAKSTFEQALNQAIRTVLGTEPGSGLTFHSMRHSLTCDLKTAGVPEGVAQSILGHASKSITYDLYGANARVALGLMVDALKKVR